MGEYFNFDDSVLVPYVTGDAMDSVINFPIYSILYATFAEGQSLHRLSAMVARQRALYPSRVIPLLGSFSGSN